jgi:hypothetical protein
MDGRRFDELTRGVGAAATRRRVVAAALGLAAATVGGDATANGGGRRQKCRAYGAGCTKSAQCCTTVCETRRTVSRARRNRCVCPEGLAYCDRQCMLLDSDEHCGACGNACPGTSVCVSGACACPDPKETLCTDVCIDTDWSFDNCGACGQPCDGSFEWCLQGVCRKPCTGSDCLTLLDRDVAVSEWGMLSSVGACSSHEDCAGYANDAQPPYQLGCIWGISMYYSASDHFTAKNNGVDAGTCYRFIPAS